MGNLVPFPRLHFMTTSLAPVISKTKSDREAHDCKRITDDCLQANSFLVKFSDFDVVEDKYMAISINYRGDIIARVQQRHPVGQATRKSFLCRVLPNRFQNWSQQCPSCIEAR